MRPFVRLVAATLPWWPYGILAALTTVPDGVSAVRWVLAGVALSLAGPVVLAALAAAVPVPAPSEPTFRRSALGTLPLMALLAGLVPVLVLGLAGRPRQPWFAALAAAASLALVLALVDGMRRRVLAVLGSHSLTLVTAAGRRVILLGEILPGPAGIGPDPLVALVGGRTIGLPSGLRRLRAGDSLVVRLLPEAVDAEGDDTRLLARALSRAARHAPPVPADPDTLTVLEVLGREPSLGRRGLVGLGCLVAALGLDLMWLLRPAVPPPSGLLPGAAVTWLGLVVPLLAGLAVVWLATTLLELRGRGRWLWRLRRPALGARERRGSGGASWEQRSRRRVAAVALAALALLALLHHPALRAHLAGLLSGPAAVGGLGLAAATAGLLAAGRFLPTELRARRLLAEGAAGSAVACLDRVVPDDGAATWGGLRAYARLAAGGTPEVPLEMARRELLRLARPSTLVTAAAAVMLARRAEGRREAKAAVARLIVETAPSRPDALTARVVADARAMVTAVDYEAAAEGPSGSPAAMADASSSAV